MKTNFEHTFIHFIKALKVPVTKTGALERLLSHPDEGSLLAYSETLNHFKIENAGIKIDKERFDELPVPFIAYLHQYGGTFALVKEVTGDKVSWLDTKKGWSKTSKSEFLKSWQGIALLAETTSESGEKKYIKKRKNEILNALRIPLAIVLLALVLGIFSIPIFTNTSVLLFPLLGLLKISGMIASGLLLVKSIDRKNEFVNKLCNNGPKVNCQSILDSPAAQVTSWLSWSDLGFIYFFGSFFALLFSLYAHNESTFLSFQWIFSISNISFGAYSVLYQGVKAKIWCILCLSVVSVFLLELFTLVGFASFSANPAGLEIKYLFTGFVIPVVFLLLFKNIALRAGDWDNYKKKLLKIYANPAYYKSLMENQPVMPEISEDMPIVTFGNKNAIHTITIVSNPLCSPCAAMHEELEELTEENPKVKCQVIFLSKENNVGGKFVRKLLSLSKDKQAMALNEWYRQNDKNFEKWNDGYKTYYETKKAADFQKMHNGWVNYAEIKATPMLFINGRKKPEGISLKELGSILAIRKEILHE